MEFTVSEPLGGSWCRGAGGAERSLRFGTLAVVTESAAAFAVGAADSCVLPRPDSRAAPLRASEQTENSRGHRPQCFPGIQHRQRQPLPSLPGPP